MSVGKKFSVGKFFFNRLGKKNVGWKPIVGWKKLSVEMKSLWLRKKKFWLEKEFFRVETKMLVGKFFIRWRKKIASWTKKIDNWNNRFSLFGLGQPLALREIPSQKPKNTISPEPFQP